MVVSMFWIHLGVVSVEVLTPAAALLNVFEQAFFTILDFG